MGEFGKGDRMEPPMRLGRWLLRRDSEKAGQMFVAVRGGASVSLDSSEEQGEKGMVYRWMNLSVSFGAMRIQLLHELGRQCAQL